MNNNVTIIIVSVVAALASYYININLKRGGVFGAALVILIAGFALPHFFPETGSNLAVMATVAAYAGMIALPKFPKLWEMVFVGIIAGLIYIATSVAYVGVGGKLGTIAAISCLTWYGIKKVAGLAPFDKKEAETKA